jgi:hypothetical protein
LDRAISNCAIKHCDATLAAGHLYGMIVGFDIFMARFSTDPPDTDRLRGNVAQAVDQFLAAYAV